jgi:hypothetical protein
LELGQTWHKNAGRKDQRHDEASLRIGDMKEEKGVTLYGKTCLSQTCGSIVGQGLSWRRPFRGSGQKKPTMSLDKSNKTMPRVI